MLTDNEKNLISQAACDFATGNHLLRERSKEQLDMMEEVSTSLKTPEKERTSRQVGIADYYRECTDYDYWKSKHQNEN